MIKLLSVLLLLCVACAVKAQPSSNAPALDRAKKKCADLGFKAGTERFGSCVLQLSRNDEPPSNLAKPTQPDLKPAAVQPQSQNPTTTLTFANGDKYVGEFKDGKPNGQGTETYANGDKYVGELKDGKRNGQGTWTSANGDKYVGEFKDGKPNGQGTFINASGDKYVGEYKDGTPNGQGTYTFANGDKYVGEHKDGNRNGQGTFTFANGRPSLKGIWADGTFVQSN